MAKVINFVNPKAIWFVFHFSDVWGEITSLKYSFLILLILNIIQSKAYPYFFIIPQLSSIDLLLMETFL